jgi:hypothetical protein
VAQKHQVRSTKRAAKERRAKLEELKRRQQRAERRRTALTIVTGVAIGGALVAFVGYSKWEPNRVGHVSDPSKAASAAGCTGVRNDGLKGRGHTTTTIKYDAVPPSSGRHNPDPLPETPQFYARDVKVAHLTERAVHNLEHGFVVGWYDAKLPEKDVDALRQATASTTRFLAVPWTRGTFPNGRHFALTSWQRTQRCEDVSAKVIRDFTAKYANSTLAPETGASGGSPVQTATPTPTPGPSGSARPSRPPGGKPSPSASR